EASSANINAGANAIPVAAGMLQTYLEPVISRRPAVVQERRAAIDVVDQDVEVAVVVVISDGRAPAAVKLPKRRPAVRAYAFEFAIAQIAKQEQRLVVGETERLGVDLRIHVAVYSQEVQPAIVIEIGRVRGPAQVRKRRPPRARHPGGVFKRM